MRLLFFVDTCARKRMNTPRSVSDLRIELLRKIVVFSMQNGVTNITIEDKKSIFRELKKEQHGKDYSEAMMELAFQSFNGTGEVATPDTGEDVKYTVTSKAFVTLAEYETIHARYKEEIGISRKLNMITLVLVLVGLVQAGVSFYEKEAGHALLKAVANYFGIK